MNISNTAALKSQLVQRREQLRTFMSQDRRCLGKGCRRVAAHVTAPRDLPDTRLNRAIPENARGAREPTFLRKYPFDKFRDARLRQSVAQR